MTRTFDIAIGGGGMVGASLALALAPLGLRIALIEAIAPDSAAQPSFDERTTAISNASHRALGALKVWEGIAPHATPIKKIHVSDRGRFGFARIDAREQGVDAMGYVLPNRALGAALWARIRSEKSIEVFCPAIVAGVIRNPHAAELSVHTADGGSDLIAASLVVAADGAHSTLRTAFGIASQSIDYDQTAVISTILPQRFHDYVAYERFTDAGPLALLPISDGRCTIVLTLTRKAAAVAARWSEQEFLHEVQLRFGFRLGRFLKAGKRVDYPLYLTSAAETHAPGCAIIGNAAQGLHPVAGMGFNLGLRDVACLAEVIARARSAGRHDFGAGDLLGDYSRWRAADRSNVIRFTDGLVRVFTNPLPPLALLRNLALLGFDLLPPAKAALSRLSTGAGGRGTAAVTPRLTRGVALT